MSSFASVSSTPRKAPSIPERAAAKDAGLDDIQTYIASGNLIFTAPSVASAEAAVEALVEQRFGFAVEAIGRTPSARRCSGHRETAGVWTAFQRGRPGAGVASLLRFAH